MKALQFNITVPKFIAAKGLHALLGNRVFYRGPFRSVRLVDIPEPSLLSDDWVKLKTLYCGFCGSDLNLMLLHDSPTASPFTSFPSVPGHEIVAEIIELGSNVSGYAMGDHVVINPALSCEVRGIDPVCPSCRNGRSANCENYAEGSLAPGMFLGISSGLNGGFAPKLIAHKSQLFKVPEGVTLEAAVMMEPLAVALQTVFDNLPGEDDTVLIIGGGVIGGLIIQSIKALQPGCQIAVMEPSAFAAELALELGADRIIPVREVFSETSKMTSSTVYKPMLGMEILMGGFDKVYDTVGASSTLNLSLRLLTAMGTLSVVGIGNEVKLDLTPLWLKLQTIKGVYAYGMVPYRGETRHVYNIAFELIREKKVKPETLLTHKFSLDDYIRLIEVNLDKGRHRAAKTVFRFI